MEKLVIKVLDFTENPGPRYIRQDREGNQTSGEAFYVYKLNPDFAKAVEENKQLVVALDGVSGYPSSFLDEAIGELVYDFTLEIVEKFLAFETSMYKKRVSQVKEETYPQWEERRKRKDNIVHSPMIEEDIYFLTEDGKIGKKRIK